MLIIIIINLERSLEKVMESHRISKAQKNTNPVGMEMISGEEGYDIRLRLAFSEGAQVTSLLADLDPCPNQLVDLDPL